jgi:FKBP-type peptidyl-prolyl cis-trans isomerase FkpA
MRYATTLAACLILCAAPALLAEEAAAPKQAPPTPKMAPAESVPEAPAAKQPVPAKPIKTKSGLEITMLRKGTGPSPTARDRVTVHYVGRFENGEVFDSSVARGKPATFPLNRVIRCWTEGLQMMQVGGKAHLKCPPNIAYGPHGKPPKIPKNATLQFDVELLDIVK